MFAFKYFQWVWVVFFFEEIGVCLSFSVLYVSEFYG